VLRGYIDVLTSDGHFQGWAYDSENLLDPLLVSIVLDDGEEVARGLAHDYREDLVAARCGVGWCGFRLRTQHAISKLRSARLRLVDRRTSRFLFATDGVGVVEAERRELTTLDEVKAADPTVLASVDQLNGCAEVFQQFIRARGIDAFVRAAYAYILARPVDSEGLRTYGRLLRTGTVSPDSILKTLSQSQEFKSTARDLSAPTSLSFPFRAS
jgi:hypothetical protein